MRSIGTWGGRRASAALVALSAAWCGTASADPSRASEQQLEAGATPPATEAPLELNGVAFQGSTRVQRAPSAGAVADGDVQTQAPESAANVRAGKRLDGLVLLSAADGVGGGGQLRSGVLGLRGTLTYRPLFFLVDADPGDNKFGAYQFSNSVQLNVDVLLTGVETERGGSLGYRFNDLMGHGVTLAYQSAFDAFGQHFNLSFPVTYYPDATGRVRDRLGIASGHEINFPFGAGIQFGMGAAWVL